MGLSGQTMCRTTVRLLQSLEDKNYELLDHSARKNDTPTAGPGLAHKNDAQGNAVPLDGGAKAKRATSGASTSTTTLPKANSASWFTMNDGLGGLGGGGTGMVPSTVLQNLKPCGPAKKTISGRSFSTFPSGTPILRNTTYRCEYRRSVPFTLVAYLQPLPSKARYLCHVVQILNSQWNCRE
jgi:hypothetical protein